MTGIAGYQAVRAQSSGPRDSEWLAIAPGGREPSVVIERCEPGEIPGAFGGDALALFFERRALQRRLAAASGEGPGGLGRGHVVPVLDLGATEEGGYAVRPAYDLSAADLIRGKVRVRGDALHEIVSGIVSALGLIERAGARPHGDLDPGAVLLSDFRPGRMRVGLRHPLPGRLLDADLAAVRRDELRRLGLLIYELVMQRPFRELGGYPVRESAEWKALGASHGVWLGLVNELLDPKGRGLTLEAVATRLGSLKYRKPGPSPLAVAGVAASGLLVVGAVAAAVVLATRRPELPPQQFDPAVFARWCEVTPGVQALRQRVSELAADAPGRAKLEEAVGALTGDLTQLPRGLGDYFDPNGAAVVSRYDQRRSPGLGQLGGLRASVLRFWDEAQAGTTDSDPTNRLKQLDAMAAVAVPALEMLDGDGGEVPGLGAVFAAERWGARLRLDEAAAGWEAAGASRAGGLLREPAEQVEAGVAALREGVSVPESESGGEVPLSVGPAPAAAVAAAESLIASVGSVERMAAEATRLLAEKDALASRASALAARAEIAGLPVSLSERLGRDPLLAGLPALVESLPVLDEASTLEDLPRRFASAAEAMSGVERVVEAYSGKRVDAVAMRRALGADFEAMQRRLGDRAADAAWAEEGLRLAGAWVAAAEASPAYQPGKSPRDGLSIAKNRSDLENLWREAYVADPGRSEEMAALNLAAEGEEPGIDRLLGRFGEAVTRLEAGPDWPSREREILEDLELANRLGAVLARVITDIHGEVLEKPDELIAKWERGELMEPAEWAALGRLGALKAVRDEVGGGFVSEWRSWFAASGLGMADAAKEQKSKVFRARLKSFERVVGRYAALAERLPDGAEGAGGFDWSVITPAAVDLRARAVGAALRGVPAASWEVRDSESRGGEIDSRVGSALAESGETIRRLADDLASLGAVRASLDRCELPGDEGVASAGEIGALLGRLEGEHAGLIGEAAGVRGAMALADSVLRALSSEDLPGQLGAVSARPGEGHQAVRFASLLRAGEIAGRVGGWPGDVPGMRAEVDGMLVGLREIRSSLDERDWARVSGRLREVAFAWWTRGFSVATREDEIGQLVGEGPGWFADLGGEWATALDESKLGGGARFNAAVWRARESLRQDAARTAAEAKAIRQDKAAVERLQDGLKARAAARAQEIRGLAREVLDAEAARAVTGWLAGIDTAIAEDRGGGAGWAAEEHGPVGAGLTGWSASLGESADGVAFVEYVKGASGLRARFHLVELSDGQKVFLGEEEVSVALFAELMGSGKVDLSPGSRLSDFVDQAVASEREIVAPVTRTVRRGTRRVTVQANAPWLKNGAFGPPVPTQSFPAYPDSLRDPSDFARISAAQGELTAGHPLNFIPFDAASEAAKAFGCRLPTEAEFRAALSVGGPGAGSGAWNLRDGSFAAQFRHFEAALQNETPIYRPGDDSYTKSAASASVWSYQGAGSETESTLWFQPTGEAPLQRGVRFKHLIGNVAEFVTPAAGGKGAMGASALSDPGAAPGEVFTGLDSVDGYADAGFRLAIDADGFGSFADALARLMRGDGASAFVGGGR